MSKLFRMQVKQKFCQGYDCGRRFGLDNSLNKTGTEITPPCFASSLTEFSGSIVYQTLAVGSELVHGLHNLWYKREYNSQNHFFHCFECRCIFLGL